MLFVHRKFDADRLSKKKVIEKIRSTTFVDFGHHLGLNLDLQHGNSSITIGNYWSVFALFDFLVKVRLHQLIDSGCNNCSDLSKAS